jgi:hypothetical protein
MVVLDGMQRCTLHSKQDIVMAEDDPNHVDVLRGDTLLVLYVDKDKTYAGEGHSSYTWMLLLHNRTRKRGWHIYFNEFPIRKVTT